MTSYLRSWLSTGTSTAEAVPSVTTSPSSSDDETIVDGGDQDDSPPAFPSLSSAQRVSSNPIPPIFDSRLMPPPPSIGLASRQPGVPSNPSSSKVSSSLLVPTTTTRPPAKLGNKRRAKVALAPGFGPLDWANLKSSGEDLRGVDSLMRIPPSILKTHNKKDDAWSAFNGKVYNITPYLSYHPGGEKELMRVAGRDGTQLFASTHAWVNVDFMLDACLVGFLVAEPH